MTRLRVGSDAHRNLMCREFIDTFRSYEASDIRWPQLEVGELARLRAMPILKKTLHSERTASRRIRLMVEAERDPVCGELLIMAETTSGTQSCESLTYR